MTLQEEITRRRTFAIISHPDAGKTTLTEKFLLYGGAIQTVLSRHLTALKNELIGEGILPDVIIGAILFVLGLVGSLALTRYELKKKQS